jgi:intraflagellar transport protein 52
MSNDQQVEAESAAASSLAGSLPVMLFDAGKDELRTLQDGFKQLMKKFRAKHKFVHSKEELSAAMLEGVRAVVIAAPQKPFEPHEIEVLQQFMRSGGRVGVFLSEAGDPSYRHMNALLEEHGISVLDTTVVRTVYHREFYHPKEAFISNVSLAEGLNVLAHKPSANTAASLTSSNPMSLFDNDGLNIVYPFGCSLRVTFPAIPIMSSGPFCLPAESALGAIAQVGKGLLLVCGSVHVFEDAYIDRVDNAALAAAWLRMLTDDTLAFKFAGNVFSGAGAPAAAAAPAGRNAGGLAARATAAGKGTVIDLEVDPDRPECSSKEQVTVPDTEALAERLRPCLQEPDELPRDFMQCADYSLFRFSTHLVPEAVALHGKLGVPHEQLALVPPVFDVPLPPTQPAVFPPLLREPPPPALELFDLDEHFASEKLRLAQLTNKCGEGDLEYFVQEAGNILGVSAEIRRMRAAAEKSKAEKAGKEKSDKETALEAAKSKVSANDVLAFVLAKLVQFKRIDGGDEGMPAGLVVGGNDADALPDPSAVR